jgi:HEAT repeat protein
MAAAIALDNLGPDVQAALPVLQKSLRDGNWFVRSHAAAAFVRLASRDKAMLPVLLRAVMNPLQESDSTTALEEDFKGRREKEIPAVIAIDALAAIGPEVVPPLLESLKNLDFYESDSRSLNNLSFAIIKICSKVGDAQVVELLLYLLLNVHDSQKAFVLGLLSQTGVKIAFGKKPDLERLTPEDLQNVAASLSHEKWQVRAAAVAAVPALAAPPQNIISLGDALADQDWQVRSLAAATLGNIPEKSLGEIPPDFIPFLLAPALEDEAWQVRLSAIGALNRPGKTIPLLLELLNSPNQAISRAAAMKLLEFGVTSDPAENILLASLQPHQDLRTRLAALEALTKGQLNTAASAVILSLQDANPKVRERAAYLMGMQLSTDSESIHTETGQKLLQALIKALQDQNRCRRHCLQRGFLSSPGRRPHY